MELTKKTRIATAHMWAYRLAAVVMILNLILGYGEPLKDVLTGSVEIGAFMYLGVFITYMLFYKRHLALLKDFFKESQRPTEEADEGWDE